MTSRGAWSSAILGATGAAAAWLLAGLGPHVLAPQATAVRLDQLTMWLLGGMVGMTVLGGRAVRVGAPAVLEAVSGFAVGGATALAAATAALLLPVPQSPLGFIALRLMSWGGCGGLLAVVLANGVWPVHPGIRIEATAIGGFGGIVAGLVLALPGPGDLWHGLAFLLFGASLGLGQALPWIRRARAVADQVPRRGPVPGILTLRESLLYDGATIPLGSALLASQGGRVALYPASTGVVLNGRAVVQPQFLTDGGTLLVAEQRFRICLPVVHR